MNNLEQKRLEELFERLNSAKDKSYKHRINMIKSVACASNFDLANYSIMKKSFDSEWTKGEKNQVKKIIDDLKRHLSDLLEINMDTKQPINVNTNINNSNNVSINNSFQTIYENSLIGNEIKEKLKKLRTY